ncbi:MAG: penicillin-binding protein 2 [Leptolyngbyaceae cyanobacterium SM2_5_2]|nr:penicillin-binding protein 2 [Leptolyngbyaceae cyanobacterium SM2_5_2]
MASSVSSAATRHRRRRRFHRGSPTITNTGRRLVLVWSLLMVALIALAGRLVWLQLVQGDNLSQLAEQQRPLVNPPQPLRYPIVDRQGNVLAVDRLVYTLYGHPQLFKQPPEQIAAALSPILEIPEAELLSQFHRQSTGIRVVDGLSAEVASRIRQLRRDGLELLPQQQRFYPQQGLFAPIVGFVNLEGEAQAGLEIAQQEQLLLSPPEQADPALAMVHFQKAKASLKLTLDGRLQRVVQQQLESVISRHGAKRGTVMVMDVDTGEMLALATLPTYDPNQYYQADVSAFRNWAISDLYEPGSTFKPINIAIALESGVLSPDELVNDSGQIQFGKWLIKNSDFATAGGRGPISITDVLKYSSNVGMIRIMQKLPPQDYFAWLQTLGLDETSGSDLPNEAPGQIKEREQFIRSKVEPATTAFGQGLSLTPIKMMQLQAAVANGGQLVTPHVVSGLIAEDGTLLWQPRRSTPPQVFSEKTSQALMAMLEAVVEDGTGEPAQVAGYRIGGKTGTAQKANPSGGYGSGRITSFVGILPVDAPRYVVMAVIDEPQGDNAYGSTVAAPLVKQVIESLVVLDGLPPAAPEDTGGKAPTN